ncbi:MAG: carbohydrate kinase family protein [Clostridia bacterium]|nr:carbohydrate kinase family protein [Clostridia bacterium]
MTNKKGIALAGSIIHDKLYGTRAYPSLGELTQIVSIDNAVGGLVPNDAIDLRKLSPKLPVYALGRIGNDASGSYVTSEMSRFGVDVSGIKVVTGTGTGFTDVMSIIGGQRTFFTYSGANGEFCFDDIPWDTLEVDMLHLGYFLLLDTVDGGDGEKILREAQSRGIKTSIDLVSEHSDRYKGVIPCLAYVDNLIVNEVEAGALAGITPTDDNLAEIAEKLIALGVRERVIIHSPALGIVKTRDSLTTLPSYKLPRGFIKGTTGAGDAFCSGALLGIYEGRSDTEILEYASLAAIASLRAVDATSAVEEISVLKSTLGNLPRQ